MEQVKESLSEIKADIKEVKGHVIELIAQGAVHNKILSEHERRSLQLESRMEPIEKWYTFAVKLGAITTAVITTLGVLATVWSALHTRQ